ncbi:MAG: beta-lactamase family protein [Colwellia sp.]|nr:beta-lactamase family protein [Colwellia sp.]
MKKTIKSIGKSIGKLSVVLLSMGLFACGNTEQPQVDLTKLPEDIGQTGDGLLKDNLEAIRRAYNLPAVSAMIIKGNEVLEMDIAGFRDANQLDEITIDDRWHIGSLTKSMTATIAARLVEQGLISFQSTVSEIFPELVGDIKPIYEEVTLAELLSSTSGLRRDLPGSWGNEWKNRADSLIEQRQQWTRKMLNTRPETERGKHLYSNGGYTIAGHMLEKVTGVAWETLVQDELFSPLNMNNTGFGPPNFDQSAAQISGHYYSNGSWHARKPSDGVYVPFVMGPAGTINADLTSLAKYLMAHLSGARGNNNIISANSYQILHEAVDADYAMGWGAFNVEWTSGKVLTHGGSNSFWLAEWLIVPEENFAVMVIFNAAGENVSQAQGKVMGMMIDRYGATL